MKKTFSGLFLLILSASISVSAQSLTTQQKMIPFAMGMSLSVLRERSDKNFEFAIDKFGKQIRYFSAELKPVRDLKKKAKPDVRRAVVEKAVEDLQAKMNRSDRWKFLAGGALGLIYAEIIGKAETKKPLDGEAIRFELNVIQRLTADVPPEIPADIAEKLTAIGKLADESDISDKQTVGAIIDQTLELLKMISGE